MILLLIYAGLLTMVAALAYGAYHYLKRWSPWAGWAAGALALIGGVLVFPLPIHGGFILLGEALLHDVDREWRRRGQERERRRDDDFLEAYATRFAGELPDSAPDETVGAAGGLLFSGPFDLADGTLAQAKAACRARAPVGYWALPSEGDYYQYWRRHGADLRRTRPGRYLSFIVQPELRLELATTHSSHGESRAGQTAAAATPRTYCVARTAQAPERGYLNVDIPRDAFNAFQLAKTSP